MSGRLDIREVKTTEDILRLQEKRAEMLGMILELTSAHPEAYNAGPNATEEKLMENLGERQSLIDAVNEIEAELGTASGKGVPFPVETEELNKASRDTLTLIVEQDKVNRSLAVSRIEELRRELKRLNESQHSRSVYETSMAGYTPSLYFDRHN